MELNDNILQNELDSLLNQYSPKELSFYQALVDAKMSFLMNSSSTKFDFIIKENDTNG